ncbi:aspartate--tRNA ligase [Amphibacillus xylanus]|uniref:Aspartate--tRNA(Asp/Asn) ligase n=1 Tax=Amphibacillus xylanus (strain ATCC 51415 / DSM 6626 / JCM 7361 / LMG 17667 / NBRC 15112 / Ep01) TaxID=698758 RepID=K0J240_AMPXN|nr:aspartate--tRNA ligase [Amphibacillus xylanus]BAM47187.1 aspartyl-tRNA synthetase [Amphibacillus xylanus NBRC 15112]
MIETRHLAGALTKANIDQHVTLKGWVQKRRDLGGLIFIDLRDRSGIVQVVFNPALSEEALAIAETVRNEYVLQVEGTVVARAQGTINEKMKTGEIEVTADKISILNASKTPPINVFEDKEISEDTRLKYRYIDLRRESMQKTIKLRHKTAQVIRQFLNQESFLEMETPMLTKSTPEGARDYLVPSRVHPGHFYALPQSPQLFKQLIMVAGFERYYQFARCFRDEDLRADRQPEFTQIDIETSFMTSDEIMEMSERMMQLVMKEIKGVALQLPLPRMTYDEAMSRYGSDKPDTRFGLELVDLSDLVKDSDFKVFANAVINGGKVSAINVKGEAASFSRKDIDKLTDFVKIYGAKGLAWVKVDENGFSGPIAKFFNEEAQASISERLNASADDLLLFVADQTQIVYDSLGALRQKLGKDLGLIDEEQFNFLWVTDWPLLEYDEDNGRYVAAHHPFTLPVAEDIDRLLAEPEKVKASAYDLVLNGFELGGGSLRIYQRDLQEKMFKVLGFSEEEANSQFGFLLQALEYGTPPHGGIALGFDRLVMLLAGKTNLRDTILFPKTASASDPLTEAPSTVSQSQLTDLHLSVLEPKNKHE